MLAVIFVVLMILALFGVGWGAYGSPPADRPRSAGWFILWLCVAILGWVLFNGAQVPIR